MTPFQQRLNAILQFGITQVIPVVVKNPATQSTVAGYVGIGIGLVSLIEAFFPGHPAVANPVTNQTPPAA